MKIYFTFLFFSMAVFFLCIGLKVILQKRPLLLPSRYFFCFIILVFSAQFVYFVKILSNLGLSGAPPLIWINPIMLICLLIFFWIQMKRYILIGIHDDSFRNALIFSWMNHYLIFLPKANSDTGKKRNNLPIYSSLWVKNAIIYPYRYFCFVGLMWDGKSSKGESNHE